MIVKIKGWNHQYQPTENERCCQDVKNPEPLLGKEWLHKCDKYRKCGVSYQADCNGGYLNGMEEGSPVDR